MRERRNRPLTTKLEQMLTQLGFFPGASAAWFQRTVTLPYAFGRRVPAKAEFRRLDNASGGIGSQRERGRLR
jgi:hypothetical protein